MADSFEVRPIHLTAAEAETGIDRAVRLGDGREVTVRVPAGVADGTLLRIPSGDEKIYLKVAFVEEPRKARFPIVPVVVVVGVIAAFIAFDYGGGPDDTATSPTTTTTTTATPITTTTTHTTTAAPTSSVESSPQDGTTVGDCLRNRGTATSPVMLPSACGPGTYKVIDRRDATTRSAFCDAQPATTHTYVVQKFTVYTRNGVEVSRKPNLAQSYVFCLSQN